MMMTGRINSASAMAPAITTRRSSPMANANPAVSMPYTMAGTAARFCRFTSISRLYHRPASANSSRYTAAAIRAEWPGPR